METKVCLGPCGRELPINSFGAYRFGRRPRCNECRARAEKERRKCLTEEQKQRVREINREASRRFRKTQKGKRAIARNNHSEARKASLRKWFSTESGKASLQEAMRRFGVKRRAWMQAEKVRRGCVDCGYDKHPAALDFDHIEGEKRFDLSKCARSLGALQAEMAKCVVRCSNCHRIKTYNDRQKAKDKRRIK